MQFCSFLFAVMATAASAFAPTSPLTKTTTTALQQSIDYNPAGLAPPQASMGSNDPVDHTLMNMVRYCLISVLFVCSCALVCSPRLD